MWGQFTYNDEPGSDAYIIQIPQIVNNFSVKEMSSITCKRLCWHIACFLNMMLDSSIRLLLSVMRFYCLIWLMVFRKGLRKQMTSFISWSTMSKILWLTLKTISLLPEPQTIIWVWFAYYHRIITKEMKLVICFWSPFLKTITSIKSSANKRWVIMVLPRWNRYYIGETNICKTESTDVPVLIYGYMIGNLRKDPLILTLTYVLVGTFRNVSITQKPWFLVFVNSIWLLISQRPPRNRHNAQTGCYITMFLFMKQFSINTSPPPSYFLPETPIHQPWIKPN